LKGFSQNVTETKTDTTKVILPVKVARLIYQDLLKYDGLKEEMGLLKLKLVKVEEREIQKDTIINLLTKKDENNQFIIGKKDEQLQVSKELTDKLHKELKGQRTKTFLWKLGTFAGIVTSTFLLIGK
jgi:phosphotransferase system IIB component